MNRDEGAFASEDQRAAGMIRDMARGRAGGLEGLYRLYQRPLLAFIASIVGEPGAAEEVLQDAFVRAYRQADKYDSALGTPFVWLATIAKRMAIDWLRKHRRRRQFVAELREQPDALADKPVTDEQTDIHQRIDARLALQHIALLPEAQRAAVALAFMGGYTHQEIADLLERPLGSVKSDLRRGLMRLRKLYLGEDD
jgi:RNA polymerase sigma-70 factor, ECF subfamily